MTHKQPIQASRKYASAAADGRTIKAQTGAPRDKAKGLNPSTTQRVSLIHNLHIDSTIKLAITTESLGGKAELITWPPPPINYQST
jgi:hypothetical protein